MQSVSSAGAGNLVFYAFDLLFLDGQSLLGEPLSIRNAGLAKVLKRASPVIVFSEHLEGDGERIRADACKRGLEGLISKRIDQKYLPDNRRVWLGLLGSSRPLRPDQQSPTNPAARLRSLPAIRGG